MGTFTLPGTEYVRGAQIRFRARQHSAFPEVPVWMQTFVRNGPLGSPNDGIPDQWGMLLATTMHEYTGALRAKTSQGLDWNQTYINDVQAEFYMKTGSNLQYDLIDSSEVYIDLIKNNSPSVTLHP